VINDYIGAKFRAIIAQYGQHPQPGIGWSMASWEKLENEADRNFVRGLRNPIQREHVRNYGLEASKSLIAARRAFLATMVWGFGNVGYGRWRTERMMATANFENKIFKVAELLGAKRTLDAYQSLALKNRIVGLGPAFGTKYLYFARGRDAEQSPPLILDRLVAQWLRENISLDLNPVPWSQGTYKTYLEEIHRWANELNVTAEKLECCIFQAQANQLGNQWGGENAATP